MKPDILERHNVLQKKSGMFGSKREKQNQLFADLLYGFAQHVLCIQTFYS